MIHDQENPNDKIFLQTVLEFKKFEANYVEDKKPSQINYFYMFKHFIDSLS